MLFLKYKEFFLEKLRKKLEEQQNNMDKNPSIVLQAASTKEHKKST